MTTTCNSREKNLKNCNCTYSPCSRKGICCECVSYHVQAGELPACFFDTATEATYDRSSEAYVRMVNSKKPGRSI